MSQIQPLWLQGSGILDVTDHPPQSSWKGWEWAGRNSSCVAVSKHERKARKDEGFLWGNWEESAEWEHTESSRYGWIGDCEHEVYCWAKKKRVFVFAALDTLIRVGETLCSWVFSWLSKQGMCLHGSHFLRLCSEQHWEIWEVNGCFYGEENACWSNKFKKLCVLFPFGDALYGKTYQRFWRALHFISVFPRSPQTCAIKKSFFWILTVSCRTLRFRGNINSRAVAIALFYLCYSENSCQTCFQTCF